MLNDQQADCFVRITESIVDPQLPSNVQVLKGSAGTGKTFLTRQIVKCLIEKEVNVVQVAPTGKAAKNMATGSSLIARTIHSAIYKLEQLPQGLGVKFLHKPNSDSRYTVYVVDESSMINDKATLNERFQQAGGLLSD
jgi:ATP-dependent exoDNAse (exonuclease V) alpha subunit